MDLDQMDQLGLLWSMREEIGTLDNCVEIWGFYLAMAMYTRKLCGLWNRAGPIATLFAYMYCLSFNLT